MMAVEITHSIYPKAIECVITCFNDGSISIKDIFGNEVEGVKVSEFFLTCKCNQITEIQESLVDIKVVESDGKYCKLKKYGDKVYKISCEHE